MDWKEVYAFCWLACMVGLAAVFGLGKVEEKTSYGLMPIVVALAANGPKRNSDGKT